MKLIYIANLTVATQPNKYSVLDSQVIELINFYSATGLFKEIVLMAGLSKVNDEAKAVLRNKVTDSVKLCFYKSYPVYPVFNRLTSLSIQNQLKQFSNLNTYVIHVRSDDLAVRSQKALSALKIQAPFLIADVRGAIVEETSEYWKKNVFLKRVKLFEKRSTLKKLNNINHVFAVSQALKDYLVVNAGIKNDSVVVNPCLATQLFKYDQCLRETNRKNMGVKENDLLVILVTGGGAAWQNTENTVKRLASMPIKVLNLSPIKMSANNVINKYVPHHKVPGYLSAADVAIIWREPSVTNRVAAPVKFSEFASIGLPVISNKSVKSIEDYIKSTNSGMILNSLNELSLDVIIKLSKMERRKLSDCGLQTFGIKSVAWRYIKTYQQIYSKLVH